MKVLIRRTVCLPSPGGLLILVALLPLLAACRKDLCYTHDEHALTVKAVIRPQWVQEWEKPIIEDWKRWHPGEELPERTTLSLDEII